MSFSLRAPRAATAALAVLFLALTLAALAPAASGQTPSPSPSPSGSASPEGPGLSVQLLNPSPAYDDTPKVSDRFDGVDSLYTIVARTTGSAESAILEAVVSPQNSDGTYQNEILIGDLVRAGPESDVWQLDWDIPSSLREGLARITVRAFVETAGGFVETGSDSAVVDVFYSDPTAAPLGAYETVDLVWPEQDGPLGWYKPRVGAWRVVIDGTTSPGANFVQLFFSTSAPGQELSFVPCGNTGITARGTHNTFSGRCTLDALTLPSQVTTIAALAEYREAVSGTRFPQAADVRSVDSYDLDPHDMSVAITPLWRRAIAPAAACQSFTVTVTDEHGRPVLGANVDMHATGPTDELVIIGNGIFVPQDHATEQTLPCPSSLPLPQTPRTQGDHNVPGGIDSKHMETGQGTGLDLMAQPSGETGFMIASENPGFTDLLVWVDEEQIGRETQQRGADDDRLEPGEPAGAARLQWLRAPITLSLDPVGGTSPTGTCFPYVVKARAGTAAVPGINVDVHATGPDDALDFCSPPDAIERRAPSAATGANAHEAEEPTESHHFSGDGADAQHTEGETDPAGNFVVGLTSPITGDTSVVAWIDGEAGADNDVQDGGETSTSGTISWASAASEAELGFLAPSPYGGDTSAAGTAGGGSGTQLPDAGGVTTIRVRADLAAAVPAIEILLSRDNRATYATLGEAERVGQTDVYELVWPIDLPDGNYGLRARIPGTTIVEDVNVKVGAGDLLPMVPAPAYETLRLDRPEVAKGVPFSRRATVVAGSTSAGAEGVDVFYTKVPAKDTPRAVDWIFCGYAGLDGTGTTRQEFSTVCTLTGGDQAEQVTGIAAITFDCTAAGCDANPRPEPAADGTPALREQGQKETGQALRVFGYDAHPLLAVEPPETEAVTRDCRRLHVVLRDQTGQPLGRANVDLHLEGAAPSTHFCRPADAAPSLRAPDGAGHTTTAEDPAVQLEAHHDGDAGPLHTEAETLPDGSLVFGVTSETGDTRVTAWLDRNDDDVQDANDPSDTALVHWVAPRGCSIVGSEGPDVLSGTPGNDVFCGLEGNDVFRGLGGDDTVFAGEGADRIFGGDGRDTIRGGRGRDLLDGGRGRDVCRGGPGVDRIRRCETGSRERTGAAPRRSGV
ncbi:MAG: hypothetical protein M3279_01780 [Actinomycetota bacterium]|nr:hypothetical protein [Actinomycetota bacterium]